MQAIFLALLLMVNSVAAEKEKCDCKKVAKTETTRSGGNQHIVIKEEKIHRTLRGAVGPNITPPLTVLVEVFDNPDHLLLNYPENLTRRTLQRRIAACETSVEGRFCFRNIPSGKYEMRFSIGPGWDVTSVYIVVDPTYAGSTSEEIYVGMQLGN
jgi:hypothetical protein